MSVSFAILAILAKGRFFADLRLKAFVHIVSKFVMKKQINTVSGYYWGPSFEGPQNVTNHLFSV
jgi:hypothetical protein